MKRILFQLSLVVAASAAACVDNPHSTTKTANSQCAPSDPDCQDGSGSASACGEGEHSCACATGSYCLEMGALCLDPEAACPASACGEGEHSCACATGSYCLEMGALCLAPSSPCP
jgi:hypothetical protein